MRDVDMGAPHIRRNEGHAWVRRRLYVERGNDIRGAGVTPGWVAARAASPCCCVMGALVRRKPASWAPRSRRARTLLRGPDVLSRA